MVKTFHFCLSLVLFAAIALGQGKHLEMVEFFGYGGMDTEAVRSALPFREGDAIPSSAAERDKWKEAVRNTVLQTTGQPATDVATVCCNSGGHWMIYIGLSGTSAGRLQYNPVPVSQLSLPADLVRLDAEIDQAWYGAVQRGNTGEERATGYALSKDPALRAKQLALRKLALRYERQILLTLTDSSDASQRAIAASALGYARQTETQYKALIKAGSDSNPTVRNNAARALIVLMAAKPTLRRKIPMSVFVDFVRSGTWSDRNKGSFLLEKLTTDRDKELLAQLRLGAIPSLIEISKWRYGGHAYAARVLLGRLAGIEDKRLQQLVQEEQVDTIIKSLQLSQ